MSKLTVEFPNGEKDEFVHAYGLTFASKVLDRLSTRDLKSHIDNIRNLEIRDDDVYLATYPKCGTHWVWEILVMLRRGNAEYETKTKEAAFLDLQSPEVVRDIPSPRVLNCHYPCKLTPKEIFQKGIKIVHVMRNPKDVFVSFYHHVKSMHLVPLTNSFQEFLPLLLGDYGIYPYCPWFQYMKDWERFSKQHPEQILNLFFEDLKEDPVREIKKINSFLETGRSDDLIKRIAEACDFKNLKKADAEIKVAEKIVDENKRSNMYRKGEVGDWKNHFTVSQNERMDKWLEENFIDTDLKFRYTL
ncbi:sulfotransferase 1B1-like [Mercenaria mercenaria]|uniref:sulfotransferase 1B1-like n=1 Tax=Mercenaria mercenaria TaxID=6596 RepID=UPI001E1D78A3|nr:sulfotransferase 1B1-like [Mercenaria mercenaria]